MTKKHRTSLAEFSEKELQDFVALLKKVFGKYNTLCVMSFPYIIVMHQAPTDGKQHDYYHWHMEFYPPLRTAKKLKYLAGCEAEAGSLINDTLA